MGHVAADRTGVHGARGIDVPPGSTRRQERDSGEGAYKNRHSQGST